MAAELKRAEIITNIERDVNGEYAESVRQYLLSKGCNSFITDARFIESRSDVDFYVVVGGDGTMLHASHTASEIGIPMIGINLGHLGYMTELESSEMEMLGNVVDGSYTTERRMMLSTSVYSGGYIAAGPFSSLNDSTITNSKLLGMVDIELRCDGGVVGHYRADGIICATPTGSTAYSLSAGGPVVDPTLDCMCVTVVSPHSLKVRPMIFSPESVLEFNEFRRMDGECYLTIDGNDNYRIHEGDTVRISRCNKFVKLIRVKPHSFYSTLNEKMAE